MSRESPLLSAQVSVVSEADFYARCCSFWISLRIYDVMREWLQEWESPTSVQALIADIDRFVLNKVDTMENVDIEWRWHRINIFLALGISIEQVFSYDTQVPDPMR